MFQLLCKKFPSRCPALSVSHTQSFLQIPHFSTSSNPKSIVSEEDNRLFLIDYLTKTCGLSPERAQSASRYLNIGTQEKPDSVISFFQNQGFTKTQISCLTRSYPTVLELNPERTLLPKIEFFRSLGLSNEDVAVMISRGGSPVLARSLEKQIIPLFRYISSFIQSHEKTLVCIKRFCLILGLDLETVVIPNLRYLGEVGVPHEKVVTLLRNRPYAISFRHNRFREVVDEVRSMGFDPVRGMFAVAVLAFGRNSKSSWKKKVETYKSQGLSDGDVLEAFQRYPFCMCYSADKIMKTMDFLVSKMGFDPSLVMKWPHVVSYSLEKRIVPRCIVYQALLAKDLLPKKGNLRLWLGSPERKFLINFVEPFEAQVPGLLMMYKNIAAVST